MAIPKYAGLSRLADVADEQIGVFSYPVKKKHQPRRLDPNWGGIIWLEDQSETDTEIESVTLLGNREEWAQMNGVRARGWYAADGAGHYPRRMFDVFELEASSSGMISYARPCPACHDFSRSWACDEHPELPYDIEKRRFVWPKPVRPTALPDFSITIEGTIDPGILEITGETVQSASSTTERDGIPSRHTVQIEVE